MTLLPCPLYNFSKCSFLPYLPQFEKKNKPACMFEDELCRCRVVTRLHKNRLTYHTCPQITPVATCLYGSQSCCRGIQAHINKRNNIFNRAASWGIEPTAFMLQGEFGFRIKTQQNCLFHLVVLNDSKGKNGSFFDRLKFLPPLASYDTSGGCKISLVWALKIENVFVKTRKRKICWQRVAHFRSFHGKSAVPLEYHCDLIRN